MFETYKTRPGQTNKNWHRFPCLALNGEITVAKNNRASYVQNNNSYKEVNGYMNADTNNGKYRAVLAINLK